MLAALDVARWILCFCHDHGDPITNLKLQKLLYYSQAWHLVLYDKPLFAEDLEAWAFGPVVYTVYRQYKRFRNQPIDCEDETSSIPDETRGFLKEVLEVFGGYSSYQLERMTHNEMPWRKARKDLPPDIASRNIISHEDMKRYYRELQKTP